MITIAQYAIMRFSKQKGGFGALEAHHERTKEKYKSNPDIDIERSKHNIHIIKPETSYKRESDNRIESAGCRTRKDSVRFIDTLITASPDFFKGKKREEIKAYFKTAVDFLSKKIGRHNIFTAVVHLDERTPHMHLCFTPITEDGRLSAKDIIGNRTQLTKWQDAFFSHMVKAYPDIERGESASKTGRRHIPMRVFKQAVNLTKQAEKIKETLDSINPLNAGKKRDELMPMITRFIPNMEVYLSTVKKYKGEFERQEKINASLKKEIESSKITINERMDAIQLQRNFDKLKAIYDAIPEEYRREAAQSLRVKQQRQPRERGDR